MLSANGATLRDVITINLIDNKAVEAVSNLSFTSGDQAYRLTFTKKPESQGFYRENDREEDEYTVSDIRFDITPVNVKISTIE